MMKRAVLPRAVRCAKVISQMKKLLLTTLMTAACLVATRAAISVGPGGSTIESFAARPAATEWSTKSITGADALFGSAANVDNAVQTNATAATITAQVLDFSPTNPPAQNALASWTSGGTAYLQTRPTGNGATLLMATLQNDTGVGATALTLTYTLAQSAATPTEQVPGHQVYVSLTGALGSWVNVAPLSGGAVGAKSNTIPLPGTWAAGATMYVLWADDNATGGTDRGHQIDDVQFTASVATFPLTVTLTAPTNSVLIAPATVPVSATTSGTVPATSVSFYTNDVLFATDATAPYSDTLVNLPSGTYRVHAVAVNGSETAFSVTNVVIVRSEFIDYVSGIYTENFNGMTATGIVTPQGWWVGAAAAGTAQFVMVGDGSAAPSATVHGWNYGVTADPNRSLGTAATGGDRNMVARIRNTGSSNIDSFNLLFDAELWRTHQTNTHIEYLTNYVSFDLGTTWIATTFDFQSPPDIANSPAATALDGHQATNRVAGLGGSVVPPSPVPPGGVIYIRWNNFNDAGGDGALAIDNVSFQATTFSPPVHFVTVTSPANGATLSGGCFGATNVTVTATASFTTTNVAFQLDGGAVVNDSTAPFSVTFPAVGLGAHTITATARTSAGATAVTNSSFTVQGNTSPTILYTNVYSYGVTGLVFEIGSPITNQFGITDADGTIAGVEFLVNGILHYATNFSFGQIIVNNLLLGTNTFTVRATDNCGAVTQNSVLVVGTAPAAPTVLILTNGALWKYNNVGVQPPNDGEGDVWFSPNFNDSAWLSGFTEIGGGDSVAPPNNNAERTIIDIGPSTNRYTVYFRKTFTVANVAQFGSLIVRSLHDDGSAVYLNGTLVATFNTTNQVGMPFAYTDLAGAAEPSDGTRYYSSNIVNSLIVGVNTLAVEVHQNSLTSSDVSFDLMLWGTPPAGTALRIVQISSTQAEVSWPDSTPLTALLYSTTDLNPPVTWSLVGLPVVQSGGFYRVTVNTTGQQKFYTLRQ